MRDTTSGTRDDALLYFDRLTMQFLVVCEAHSLRRAARSTFDARLLLDGHNEAHADVSSEFYLPVPSVPATKAEHLGRLLSELREGLGLSVECVASLSDLSVEHVIAAERGELDDGPVQMSLSATYSAVAAGLSNAAHA